MFDPTIKKSVNLQKRITLRIKNKATIQAVIKQSIMKKALERLRPKVKKAEANPVKEDKPKKK
jgi:hypothetical protein